MDDIYQRLDQALERYANDEAACVLDVSELDGFFHALGCSPQAIPATVWLSAIWGGEAFMPRWPDAAAARQFETDALAHHASVMNALAQGECAPVYLQADGDGEIITVVDAWCEGFLLGMDLWPDSAAEPPDELLEPILFFTVDLEDPDQSERVRASTPEEEIVLLQELIPQSVFGLRDFYGLSHAAPPRPHKPGQRSGQTRGPGGKGKGKGR